MRQNGFSLLELMVVIFIIGILAAIAIPSFLALQEKAKERESGITAVDTSGDSEEVVRGKVRNIHTIVIFEDAHGDYYSIGEEYNLTDFPETLPTKGDKVAVFRINDRLSVKVTERAEPSNNEQTTNPAYGPIDRTKQ